MTQESVIKRYFAAMRQGAGAEEDMIGLFTDDAYYEEPFSGEPPAHGRDEIRARFRSGWETPLPDMELDVLEVEIEGRVARSRWECRSPALPGPVQGTDEYEIVDGRIARLVVRLDR